MKIRLQQSEMGLALYIPEAVALEADLKAGDTIEMSVINGCCLVIKFGSMPTLDDLLAEINERNLHGEIDTGNAVGNEYG